MIHFQLVYGKLGESPQLPLLIVLRTEIDDILYGDGASGWNNLTREAISEANSVRLNRPIGQGEHRGSVSLQLRV